MNSSQMTTESNSSFIRVARECWPTNVWVTQAENGTVWHGAGMLFLLQLQKSMNLRFKFVHDLPPAKDTHHIMKGAPNVFYHKVFLR